MFNVTASHQFLCRNLSRRHTLPPHRSLFWRSYGGEFHENPDDSGLVELHCGDVGICRERDDEGRTG
jgi:hypothetical protein